MRGNVFRQSLMIVLCFVLASCAHSYSPDAYSPGGMQQANKVDRATVVNVREVDVNDPSLGLGTASGAALGGIGAAQIGKGSGNAAAILGGVLIGGAIGWLIDQEANSTTAFEYILEKSSGDLITVAQKQETPFSVGDRVFILYGVQARVIPDSFKAGKSAQHQVGKSE